MRRILRHLTAAGILSILAVTTLPAADAAASGDKLFMWELRSETTTVYLLGSIHLAREDLYPLDPAIESAFAESAVLVLEVNMVQMDPAEIQKKLFESGQLPEGKALGDVLSEKTMGELSGYLEKRGLPVQGFSMFQPWLISFTLSVMELQRLGFQPQYGLDMHFLNLAVEHQKGILGLETGDSQIQLFASLTPEMQEMFLQSTLSEMEKLPGLIDQILDAWNNGDDGAMASLLLDPKELEGPLKPFYERLYFQRNVAMTEKIRSFMNSSTTHFVVIGAGHLVGENGILDLLGEADYSIRQITSAPAAAAAAR
jgi:uncharacterized protein YbaP (TraB family)